MIIKGIRDPENKFREIYESKDFNLKVNHFVVRTLTPENPFKPHSHEQEELWYIIEGKAILILDSKEYNVESGDLIHLKPWVSHGINTDTKARWICLG